jgi:hypothetical protein
MCGVRLRYRKSADRPFGSVISTDWRRYHNQVADPAAARDITPDRAIGVSEALLSIGAVEGLTVRYGVSRIGPLGSVADVGCRPAPCDLIWREPGCRCRLSGFRFIVFGWTTWLPSALTWRCRQRVGHLVVRSR